MADLSIPLLPESVPKRQNKLLTEFGKFFLKLFGWRVKGEFPNQPKLVIALAPHTSNWDFVIAMIAMLATGVRLNYLMKKEAFIWPLSGFWRWLGGIAIDRSSGQNVVKQIASEFDASEKLWVAITPEGTRRKVTHWKTGFLRVAERAQVPVFIIAWDYANKSIVLDRAWPTSGDYVMDAEAIKAHINARYQGRHPHWQ